jgi:hypothetical protein
MRDVNRKSIVVTVGQVEEAYRREAVERGLDPDVAWNTFWRQLILVRDRDRQRELRSKS